MPPKQPYSQFGLTDLSEIKNLNQVKTAWDRYIIAQNTIPSQVSYQYHKDFIKLVSRLKFDTFWRIHPEKEFQYPINPNQAREISDIVQNNIQAFTYETLGVDLPKEKLKELKRKKIITRSTKRSDFPKDIYMFGRTMNLLEQGIDYYDARRMAIRNPLSEIEKTAISHIRNKSAEHVTGLANGFTGKIQEIIKNKNQEFIREMIAEGKEKLMTNEEIVSAIGHATGDWGRDLFRIVYTEGHTGQQLAVALDMEKKFGKNPRTGEPMTVWVAKQPEPDACAICYSLYVNPDGSLKKFSLESLLSGPLTNEPYINTAGKVVKRSAKMIGNKALGMVPVIGATHPYCQCLLVKYSPHLHDREFIENEIKIGNANKNELTSVNLWKKGFEETKGDL